MSTRFQGLVEDLLEISRFDAGAIRLHLEELLAAEFVRQAVAVSSLPSTPIEVSERAERRVIRGDRRRLARVIANLIDNARAYGGGEPEITMSVVDDPDDPITQIQIAVEDRGAGVAENERDLIFERFARGGGRRAPDRQRWRGAGPGAGRRARADARWKGVGGRSTRRRERCTLRHRTDGDGARRMTRTLLRSRAAVAAIVLMTAVAGCAIQPDGAPRAIPEDDQSTAGPEDSTGDVAAGSSLIFLLAPNEPDEPQQLRSVMREPGSSDTSAVLRSLLSGPNRTERSEGMETAIPPGLVFSSPPRMSDGTLTVDVGEGLDELDAVDLQFAVAQIVTTATRSTGSTRWRSRSTANSQFVAARRRRTHRRGPHPLRLPRLRRIDTTGVPDDPVSRSLTAVIQAKNGSATSR